MLDACYNPHMVLAPPLNRTIESLAKDVAACKRDRLPPRLCKEISSLCGADYKKIAATLLLMGYAR